MKKRSLLLLAVTFLAGCQDPVDPASIKIAYGFPKATPRDKILIVPDFAGTASLAAEPGEKITLAFNLFNTVRDEVFVQMDESTAYVASLVIFLPGDQAGRLVPMNAPIVNPAASAGSYKRLLKSDGGSFDGGSDRSLKIALPVDLPKLEWEKIEISVVFSVRGYTRETRGEFRDTITDHFTVTRKKPLTQPATVPSNPGFFVRPATNPATLP